MDGQIRADGLIRARPLGWARGNPSATAFGRVSATHIASHIRVVAGSWRVLEPAVVDGQIRADGLIRAQPLGWARINPSATAFERASATHRAKHIRAVVGSWRALEPAVVDGQKNRGRIDTCPTVRMGAWQSVRDRFWARQRDTHSKPY